MGGGGGLGWAGEGLGRGLGVGGSGGLCYWGVGGLVGSGGRRHVYCMGCGLLVVGVGWLGRGGWCVFGGPLLRGLFVGWSSVGWCYLCGRGHRWCTGYRLGRFLLRGTGCMHDTFSGWGCAWGVYVGGCIYGRSLVCVSGLGWLCMGMCVGGL